MVDNSEHGRLQAYARLEAGPLFREFIRDIAIRLDRLETQGMMPEAVCLRSDLWPHLGEVLGYPVIRLATPTPRNWGVLA